MQSLGAAAQQSRIIEARTELRSVEAVYRREEEDRTPFDVKQVRGVRQESVLRSVCLQSAPEQVGDFPVTAIACSSRVRRRSRGLVSAT
jgi:hypothetical protein